ncbi:MAG: hypothetical protein ABL977_07115 [Candidatus Eisenbacteria bacterium]
MLRHLSALALAGCLFAPAAFAAAPGVPTAPVLLARSSGSISITRTGAENPVLEVAKSTYWGAVAGLVLGGAVSLARDKHTLEPIRWGIAMGAFGGFGAGVYFVANRPVPTGFLELRDGRVLPGAALAALEPVPGGVLVHAVGVRF